MIRTTSSIAFSLVLLVSRSGLYSPVLLPSPTASFSPSGNAYSTAAGEPAW